VNINKNMNGIEVAAIGLSALGTVAAVVTQQIAYVAAPLTLSLSLSLIDRQKALGRVTNRLANLEQQFASDIESAVKQSQAIQAELHDFPPTVSKSDFEKLAKTVSANRQELKRISTALIAIEQRGNDLVPFLTEIDLTKDSLKQLSLNFSKFEQELAHRQGTANVASIDRATDEIRSNVRNPISIDDNVRLAHLSLNLSELDSDSIYLSIAQIKSKIQLLEESSKVAEDSIKQVGWRFLELEQAFTDRQDPIAIVELDRSISDLRSSMEQTNFKIQSLEAGTIATDLLDRVNDLDVSLGDLHDYNLKLTNRINNYTQYEIVEIINIAVSDQNISSLIQQEIDRSIGEQFEIIKQILPKQYAYTLVSGRSESRQVFLDALAKSQERLILVCPWLTKHALDKKSEKLMIAALNRGVHIDIGWGHLSDVENRKLPLSKESLLSSPRASKWGGYNAVNWVYELQDKYDNLLNLKILGTHEKFLVCDRQFAMLGSHNYLTSNTSSSEREVGLKTDSPELIDKLIELFDRAEA
jgi:PLD-like domain